MKSIAPSDSNPVCGSELSQTESVNLYLTNPLSCPAVQSYYSSAAHGDLCLPSPNCFRSAHVCVVCACQRTVPAKWSYCHCLSLQGPEELALNVLLCLSYTCVWLNRAFPYKIMETDVIHRFSICVHTGWLKMLELWGRYMVKIQH